MNPHRTAHSSDVSGSNAPGPEVQRAHVEARAEDHELGEPRSDRIAHDVVDEARAQSNAVFEERQIEITLRRPACAPAAAKCFASGSSNKSFFSARTAAIENAVSAIVTKDQA